MIELPRQVYSCLRDKWHLPWWALWLLLFLCFVSGASAWFQPWLLRRVELKTYDVSAPAPVLAPSPRILLVTIGERSLSALGAWPFARRHHAELLSRLAQARVVGFDILFAESTKDDPLFAKAIAEHDRVVLAAHTAVRSDAADAGQFTVEPVPLLLDAAADVGFTNVETDIDGLVRYARPIRSAGSDVLPSLGFALARQMLQEEGQISGDDRGISIFLGKRGIRLTSDARLWFVPTIQGPPSFEYVDVLAGQIPPETFRDSAVLVGTAASGLSDFQIIPDALGTRVISGVHYNAEELRALLSGKAAQIAPDWLNALAASALALLAGLLISFMRPVRASVCILIVCFLWFSFAWILLRHQLFWVAGAIPVLAAVATGTLMLLARQVLLHESWRTQSVSLDSIVYLNAEEASRYDSLEKYLESLWVRVEKETGIRFLGGPMDFSELPDEFAQSTPGGNGVFIVASGAKLHRMAVPLHKGEEATYGLFSWNRRINLANARAVAALAVSATLLFQVQKDSRHRRTMLMDTIKAVFTALDFRDPITGGHSTRVSELSLHLMERLALPQQLLEDIGLGALIHDLGKIGIPDKILNKRGKLSSDEYQIIRSHPNIAQSILASVDLPPAALDAILEHHERYDGSGYPRGLQGKEISLAGRVVAIADAFDALSHDRPYRNGQSLDEVLKIMSSEAGSHFDRGLFEIFEDMVRRSPPHV